MFTNGMLDVMQANSNFTTDLEYGLFGRLTKEEIKKETSFENYNLDDKQ
jgi:hypothetical protein